MKAKSADDTIRELVANHSREELVELVVAMSQPTQCPPHNFRSAYAGEDRGAIFCRWCGDVAELVPASIAAPMEEMEMCPNCVTPWKCNGPHVPVPVKP